MTHQKYLNLGAVDDEIYTRIKLNTLLQNVMIFIFLIERHVNKYYLG